jgi:hypothetical protein
MAALFAVAALLGIALVVTVAALATSKRLPEDEQHRRYGLAIRDLLTSSCDVNKVPQGKQSPRRDAHEPSGATKKLAA